MQLGHRWALAGGFLVTACATPPPDPAALEAELLAADRAFNEANQARGSDGWVDFFAPDGVFIQAGVGEIRGTEAIRSAMLGLDRPDLDLRWEPERAYASVDGTMGYTVGGYVSTVGTGAEAMTSRGRYVTIWRRQADGSLKVTMDLGNPTD